MSILEEHEEWHFKQMSQLSYYEIGTYLFQKLWMIRTLILHFIKTVTFQFFFCINQEYDKIDLHFYKPYLLW